MTARRLVLGIGNPDRGDDGAGPAVAARLQGLLPADVEVAVHGGEMAGLLARLEGAASAFLVDACLSGAPPGSIRRLDVGPAPLPPGALGVSTHGFGLGEAVELARALRQLPPVCVIYAIEGTGFETGAPLSPAVAAAVAEVAERLRAEIGGEG
jgi:hydrogenase maturation protease